MASVEDVPIVKTPKGVRVSLGKLYMYPDGHANLTFDSVPDEDFSGLNLPLTNAVDVLSELTHARQTDERRCRQGPADAS